MRWCPLFFLLACTPDVQLASSDVRLDGAVAAADPDSTHPRLCVSEAGRVYVVWTDDRDGVPAIWLNRSEDGGTTWLDAPVRVNRGPAAAVAPDLACATARDGDTLLDDLVYVAWEDARDGELENRNVYLVGSEDSGASWWAEDRRMSEDPNGRAMHLGPRVVAGNDEVYVAWFDGGAGAFDVMVAGSHTRGAEFNAPVRVDGDEPGAAYSAWPDLTTDGRGHATVVWEDSRDGASDIYAASTSNGGFSFGPAVRLDVGATVGGEMDAPGSANSFRPRVASRGPSLFAVWHDERNGEARDVYVNWSLDWGETWQVQALRVDGDAPGFTDSLNPAVAVVERETDGARFNAQIVWQDARVAGFDVYHRGLGAGELSATEARLDTDGAGFGNSLDAAIAVDGELVVAAWEDRRDDPGAGYNEIYYAYSVDGGRSWAPQELRLDSLERGTSYKVDLQLSVVGGAIHAVWVDGRNGTADVYFHRLLPGEQAEFLRLP